jgi:phage tail protein X
MRLKEQYLGTIQSIEDEMRKTDAVIAAIIKGNKGLAAK